MNTIGIDYGQTYTIVGLLEQGQTQTSQQLIGDGSYTIIPNAVCDKAFGSHVYHTDLMDRIQSGNPVSKGVWLDGAGPPVFWEHIYERIKAYIGCDPTQINHYQVVIALPLCGSSFEDEKYKTELLCRKAGFDHIETISSTDALLCQWLAQQGLAQQKLQKTKNIVVFAIGDTYATVQDYIIKSDENGFAGITFSVKNFNLLGVGRSIWIKRLISEFCKLYGLKIADKQTHVLNESAVAFLMKLFRQDSSHILFWSPFISNNDVFSLERSYEIVNNWPEFKILSEFVKQHVERQNNQFIVWGGIGSFWQPDTIKSREIKSSQTNLVDIALGATYWPKFKKLFANSPVPVYNFGGGLPPTIEDETDW